MNRSIFALVAAAAVLCFCPTSHAVATEADGKVTLENAHLKVVLVPNIGGKAESIVLKPQNIELTRWPKNGAFEDRLWAVKGYDLPKRVFTSEIQTVDGADVLVMKTRPSSPGYDTVEVEKRITLAADLPRIDVLYRFTNTGDTPVAWGFWIANDLRLPDEETRYFIPGEDGLDVLYWKGPGNKAYEDPRNVTTLGAERTVYDNPRGYQGMVGAKSGRGLAMIVPLQYLSFFYQFNHLDIVTVEAGFNKITIAPKSTLEFPVSYVTTTGLTLIHNANAIMAGQFDLTGDKLEPERETTLNASLNAVEPGEYAVTLSLTLTSGQGERHEQKKAATMKSGEVAAFSAAFKPRKPGTYIAECRVSRDGKDVFEMQRPVIVGEASLPWVWKPNVEKRLGEEMSGRRKFTFKYLNDPTEKLKLVEETGIFDRPTDEIKLFTVPVAKPFAGRVPKVLFLPRLLLEREVVDVINTFEMEWDCQALVRDSEYPALLKGNRKTLYYPAAAALREKLKKNKYDVIVMANSGSLKGVWDATPQDLRDQLCDAVKNGATLIHAGSQDVFTQDMKERGAELAEMTDNALARRVIFQDTPLAAGAWARGAPIRWQEAALGRGRVIIYNFTGYTRTKGVSFLIPASAHTSAMDYDLLRAFAVRGLGNLIYYSAGVLPQKPIAVEVTDMQPRTVRVDAATCGENAAEVTYQLLDIYRRTIWSARIPRAQFESPQKLPWLPSGEYWLTVQSFNAAGKALNWHAVAVTQTSPASIVVEATSERGDYGDSINFHVRVAGFSESEVKYRTVVTDQYNREIDSYEGCTGGSVIRDALTPLLTIEVTAWQDDRRLAVGRAQVIAHPKPTTPFPIAIYGWNPAQAREQLGFHGVYTTPRLAAQDILQCWTWGAEMPGMRPEITPRPGQRNREPSLRDPAYREASTKHFKSSTEEIKRYGTGGWIWTDEWSYGGHNHDEVDIDHSPPSLAAMREFLKELYGDLKALNGSWMTTFNEWEEVDPPMVATVKTDPRRWAAAWSDHRTYAEREVADYFRFLNQQIQAEYPAGKIGLSGTRDPSSYNAMDWWRIMQSNDYISTYGGVQVLMARSFLRPGCVLSRWTWYDSSGIGLDKGRCGLWQQLFEGYTSISDYATQEYTHFRGDLSLRPSSRLYAEELRKLNSGPAHIIRDAKFDDGGVAIHYSQRSIHAARLLNYEGLPIEEGGFNNNILSIALALQHQGTGVKGLAYAQIESGLLGKGQTKLLFLPLSAALSDAEVREIRAFVEAGGTVVADALAGLRNGHAAMRDRGALDDLFGVDHRGAKPIFEVGAVTIDKLQGVAPLHFSAKIGCANLRVTGGTPLGQIADQNGNVYPAAIYRSMGKGKAMYLNFVINDYSTYAAAGVGGEEAIIRSANVQQQRNVGSLFASLMHMAGVTPGFRIFENNEPSTRLQGYAFNNGAARYIGIVQSSTPASPAPIRIELDRTAHVYEVLTHKYFGKTNKVELDMLTAGARFLALVPEEIQGLGVEYNAGTLSLRSEGAGYPTYARVEVLRPDGSEATMLRQVVRIKNHSAQTRIPMALNDAPGRWTARVTDIISGNGIEHNLRAAEELDAAVKALK